MRHKLQHNQLLADVLGYGCLVAVPFVGWLPGPGGIPLILAGLKLLAIHHPWAQKLLGYVTHHSSTMRDLLFPPHKNIQLIWDIIALLGVFISYLAYVRIGGFFGSAGGTIVLCLTLLVFLYNRRRLGAVSRFLKRYRPF